MLLNEHDDDDDDDEHVAYCPQHVARPRNLLPRNMLRWCKRGLRCHIVAVQALTVYEHLQLEGDSSDDIGTKVDDHVGLAGRVRELCEKQSDIALLMLHRQTIYQSSLRPSITLNTVWRNKP